MRQFSPWREHIQELAKRPNVYCKFSGLATEADHHSWTEDQLRPYIDRVFEAFGARRVMFGSDWPGQDAIGRLIVGQKEVIHVVGVVRDVHHLGLEQAGGPEVYYPMSQTQDYGSMHLVVRSRLSLPELNANVRAALLQVDAGLPREQFAPLQDLVDHSVSPRRFIVCLLSGFACFALLLASLGIYAVISYSVGQRTQELGVRMALGASPGLLQRGILLQTCGLAAIGLLIGTIASALITSGLQGLLFGVTATDPAAFVGMLVVLTGVAVLAGFLPARRASRINPTVALRAD
jgi:hypothetical protein